MALTTTYMPSCKNLENIFEAIRKAAVPTKFTNEFLKSLSFTSSNDRAVIGVFKGLGFLDDTGTPAQAYKDLRDPSRWKRVLAKQMRQAYDDLFISNTSAESMSGDSYRSPHLKPLGT